MRLELPLVFELSERRTGEKESGHNKNVIKRPRPDKEIATDPSVS
jgi:hypothetical protein